MTNAPLLAKLCDLIKANGPMSIADYMALCIGDPEHGYYTTRDPFGQAGDFITAPEVSQMFGEIVGAWLIDTWQRIGAPAPAALVELGPGRGTLMADILRVANRVPDFAQATAVHLVETSPVLRQRQADTLRAAEISATWHASLTEIPPSPVMVVANEFFDALPIRQFVRLDVWRERAIGLDAKGRLGFGIGPGVLAEAPDAPKGSIVEICPAAEAIVDEIATRIADHGGTALIVDYGYVQSGPGDTLQALRGHSYTDPLERPGEADLTAHVDFSALARRAVSAGVAAHGPMPQGAFLTSLGLEERAARLGADADMAQKDDLRAAVDRLTGPKAMGTLFKVLALTPRGVVPAPFGA